MTNPRYGASEAQPRREGDEAIDKPIEPIKVPQYYDNMSYGSLPVGDAQSCPTGYLPGGESGPFSHVSAGTGITLVVFSKCWPINNGSDQRRTVSPYQWPQDKRGTNLGNRITRWLLNQLYALVGIQIPIPPDGATKEKHT